MFVIYIFFLYFVIVSVEYILYNFTFFLIMGVNFYGDANYVTVKLLQNAWIGNHWSLEMFEKKKMKLGRFVSLLNFLQKVIKK